MEEENALGSNTRYDNYSYKELALQFRQLQTDIEKFEKSKAELTREFDFLRKIVIPARMEHDQMDVVTITGVGRFTVSADMYCNTPAEKRFELQKWLVDRGFGDLVQPTVNGSTLKAFIKEQLGQGNEIPSEIVKIEPYSRASLTKVAS